MRLFHWSLAGAVAINLYTGLNGGLYEMDWHMISGYAVLGLLAFRLCWGLVGPRHARFGQFLTGPRAIRAWLRGAMRAQPPAVVGHNPAAGWFIVVFLLALALQALTGLVTSDDVFTSGPLHGSAPDTLESWAARIHRQGEWVIGALVALHLAAIAVHRLLFGERLIKPMLTGRKADAPAEADIGSHRWGLAVPLMLAAAGLFAYLYDL